MEGEREGGRTWREGGREGGRKGSTLVPQCSDQNIMHLVVYGVTSPWSGIDIHTSRAQLRQYITIYRTYSEGTLHMSGQELLSIRKERK